MPPNTLNMFFHKCMHNIVVQRFYHVSLINYNSKQGSKLYKLLNPSSKKKWHPTFTETNTLPSIKSLTKVKYEPGKRGIRRLAVLNKLFMKSITDLLSTGSSSIDIVGRGIEISKVQVSPDLQRVNVFWVCKGNSTDEETESILNSIAGPVRHELSSLRLMGVVPYIVFVKDRQETRLMDLDRRLAVADYGEDYTPTEIGHLLKTDFTLETKLSPEMRAKIKQLEDAQPIEEVPIPEMTHTVFGLDHEKILNRLLASRKKSKEAWSNIDANKVISYRAPIQKTVEVDTKKQKQDLAEFLHKRQIQQNKIYKEKRDARALKHLQMLSQDQNNDDDDDDYLYDLYDDDDDDDDDYDHEDMYAGVEKWDQKPV